MYTYYICTCCTHFKQLFSYNRSTIYHYCTEKHIRVELHTFGIEFRFLTTSYNYRYVFFFVYFCSRLIFGIWIWFVFSNFPLWVFLSSLFSIFETTTFLCILTLNKCSTTCLSEVSRHIYYCIYCIIVCDCVHYCHQSPLNNFMCGFKLTIYRS